MKKTNKHKTKIKNFRQITSQNLKGKKILPEDILEINYINI